MSTRFINAIKKRAKEVGKHELTKIPRPRIRIVPPHMMLSRVYNCDLNLISNVSFHGSDIEFNLGAITDEMDIILVS